VRLENASEYHSEFGLFGRQAADGGEETHLSVVYVEGTAFGVQATEEETVGELHGLRQIIHLVHFTVVVQLRQQHDGTLRELLVHERHVDVIDEVDQQFFLGGALDVAHTLVHVSHNHPVQGSRVRLVVERQSYKTDFVASHKLQEVHHQSGFACAGSSCEAHWLSLTQMQGHHVAYSLSLHRRHNDRRINLFCVVNLIRN
jgi:hypothetical protein